MYWVHGLRIASELPCPAPSVVDGEPDVRITYGPVAPRLTNPAIRGAFYEATPTEFIFSIDGVGSFHVKDGSQITIDRHPSAADRDLHAFLFGSVFAELMHQRNGLSLHASAFATDRGAVLLAGHSGLGKSTLCASMVQRGHRLLTDDLSIITAASDHAPRVHAGLPQLRLWSDAMTRLGFQQDNAVPVRKDIGKYIVPFEPVFVAESIPLAAIFVIGLAKGSEWSIDRCVGADRLRALKTHTFGYRILTANGKGAVHFALGARVSAAAPMFRILRPRGAFDINPLLDQVEQRIAS